EGMVPPTVPAGAAAAIGQRLDRLERRYPAAVRRHETRAFTELGTLRAALRPGGARRERALNLLPPLARHGTGLLHAMRDAAGVHAAALVGLATPDDGDARLRVPTTSAPSAAAVRQG